MECMRPPNGAFSGKAETGFPSENATMQKMKERSLLPANADRSGRRDRQLASRSIRPDVNRLDLDAVLEENRQLRELVVQLSEIVVRNVLDRR
jgi:hypothetical protein